MITDWNLLTAARTLWQEARGEPPDGQAAVAHVIVNRRATGRWGKTFGSVCLWNWKIKGQVGQGFQFSGWRGQDPNFQACELADGDPLLQKLAATIVAAQTEPDPTAGALSYYAKSMATPPAWAAEMIPCGQLGAQLFFKPK